MNLEPLDPNQPVTNWRAVARVLGLSYDTVWRRRREHGSQRKPHFQNAGEVWEWWRKLEPPEPPAPPPRPSSGQGRKLTKPLDVSEKLRHFRERGAAKQ